MAKTTILISTANAFGQTYFNLLVATGGEGNPMMPDIVFPDPIQMEDLTPEQIQAIFYAYMNQMKDWFYNYTRQAPENMTIRPGRTLPWRHLRRERNHAIRQRYDLHAIREHRRLDHDRWAEQHYDPARVHHDLGQRNVMEDYGRSTDNTYLATKAGYNLSIEEIFSAGVPVTEKTLTITKVSLIVGSTDGGITPPQGLTDLQWLINHWYWFAIVAGIVILLGAAFVRNWIFALVGLLVIAVGGVGWVLLRHWSSTTGLLSGLLKGIKLW